MTERPHLLIKGATLLTMDPDLGEIDEGDVEIRDGRIVAVGRDLVAVDAESLDGSSLIALPGFVDTHWHAWGTLLRGVVGDGKEHGWFARKAQLGPHLTPDDVATGVRLALLEGLSAGVTTVHDWNHYVLSEEHAAADIESALRCGIRVHFSAGPPTAAPQLDLEEMRSALPGATVSVDEPTDMDEIVRLRDTWAPRSEGRLSVGVNVRGPSRSTPEVYRREWADARERALPIAMHCAGTRAEADRIRQVEVLDGEGLLGADLLLAHCLYLSSRERSLCAEHGIPISVSPLSELRLAMGMPTITELREAGVSVSLSLDTTAITANADVFQAMRVAVGLESARHGDACTLSPRDVLAIATIEGARALGLGETTGSLTPGKRADLILVRADAVNIAPVVDPAVAVVHSAQPANVDTVIVDGRVLKRDGGLAGVDLPGVVRDAEEALRALCARAGLDLATVRVAS